MTSEIQDEEKPRTWKKMRGEIRENIDIYGAIFILMGVGTYFFVNNVLQEVNKTLCFTPGLMGLVVILTGALIMKNRRSGSGILLVSLGVGMVIITILGVLYVMTLRMIDGG